MLQLEDLPAACTAEEASQLLPSYAERLSVAGEVPTLRTLRLWRTRGVLTRSGRQLNRKNLLEALCIVRFRGGGLTVAAAAERCVALDEAALWSMLVTPVGTVGAGSEFAQVTLQLLAKGILEQYRRVARGAIVGHSDWHRTGIENTPLALQQAAARLGRMYFEEGREDSAASVHLLLVQCTKPLREWAPAALAGFPDLSEIVLVDPHYLVPSEDCEQVASQAPGTSAEDLIERRLHSELMQTLAKLGGDADAAYTAVREFVGRHPMAAESELRKFYALPELSNDTVRFVERLYQPVHAEHATHGMVSRCRWCRALVGRGGQCALQGCREDHPRTELASPLDLAAAHVARAEVLKYWVDPAREELRLYDALRVRKLTAKLYPHSDRCDVSVGDEIGIDVKDHRDPARLARSLNASLGGLAHYERSIVAVADRRIRTGDYIARLREQLSPVNRTRLEIRSVSETIRVLIGGHKSSGPREGMRDPVPVARRIVRKETARAV